MRTIIEHIERMRNLRQLPLTPEITSTAREILLAEVSLNYWTDVLNGTAQGPRITDPDSMSDEQIERLFGHRTATYAMQLRNSIRGLPHVTALNIDTFRNL